VILIDANLLVYAAAPQLPQHPAARAWLDARLNGEARVGLPWASLLAFLRLVTDPRVFQPASGMAAAWRQMEEWLEQPPVWIPQPTERHAQVLGRLLSQSGGAARLVPDAHLAALGIEHGLELCSNDGDFARFQGLRWSNPLAQ
jgi:hypothetical protein